VPPIAAAWRPPRWAALVASNILNQTTSAGPEPSAAHATKPSRRGLAKKGLRIKFVVSSIRLLTKALLAGNAQKGSGALAASVNQTIPRIDRSVIRADLSTLVSCSTAHAPRRRQPRLFAQEQTTAARGSPPTNGVHGQQQTRAPGRSFTRRTHREPSAKLKANTRRATTAWPEHEMGDTTKRKENREAPIPDQRLGPRPDGVGRGRRLYLASAPRGLVP